MKGFIDFIREQGVVGLAVGFILGGAVSKVVSALVTDIVNPLLGLVLGAQGGWKTAALSIGSAKILYGDMLSVAVDFIVIALVVYFGVKLLGLDKLDKKRNKILVIVGPTASGKSDLAVKLAKKFKGEVISADSRQVYKGLDIGTGKITRSEMQGVPHHMLDVANAKKQFTVADYKKMAGEELHYIEERGWLPIIVGGTGFYIDALTGAVTLPDVPVNKKLREKLMKKSNDALFRELSQKDPARAKAIDPNNKVRLVRALEIVAALGKVPKLKQTVDKRFVFVGLSPTDLETRIYKRLIKRIPGILRETKKLSPKRANQLGLEYRFASLYLQNKLSKEEFTEKLYVAIKQYSKRQMTWFKRNRRIKWFSSASSAYAYSAQLLAGATRRRSR